jgi:hypothetical protein
MFKTVENWVHQSSYGGGGGISLLHVKHDNPHSKFNNLETKIHL